MQTLKVYFFGDSICFGQGVSLHKTWVSQVAAQLDADYLSRGVKPLLQNYSINGNTTRMALERIAYDIQGKDIDVLVVQFGMNDANIWQTDKGRPRVSPASFAANLQEIIDRASTFGVSHILLNTNHPTGRFAVLPNSHIVYQEHICLYNTIVRQVAASNASLVTLVDMEAYFNEQLPEERSVLHLLPAPDLLHLNTRGNDMYFQRFYPVLHATVERLLAVRGNA